MNTLQKLIKTLKHEKEKAETMISDDGEIITTHYQGKVKAFSFAIREAELLLNEEPAKDLPEKKCSCRGLLRDILCPIHGKY